MWKLFRTLTVRWDLPVFSHKMYIIIYIQCKHKINCAVEFYDSNIHVWTGHRSSQVTDLEGSQTWLLINFIVSMMLTYSCSHQHECSRWKFSQLFACDFCFQTNAVSLSDSRWRLRASSNTVAHKAELCTNTRVQRKRFFLCYSLLLGKIHCSFSFV